MKSRSTAPIRSPAPSHITNKGGSRKWAALAGLLAAGAVSVFASRRYRRYIVSGASMLPSYREGDCLLVDTFAYRRRRARPGEVVVAKSPASVEVVKRVRFVDSEGRAWLQGDSPEESTDSRDFGPVAPGGIVGRVVVRYWPLT